jgi:sortase A
MPWIEGSTDDMVAKAAGHIEDAAFPGEPGSVVIAEHRDTTFRALRHLQVGGRLRLMTTRGVFDCRIVRTVIVNPGDVQVLDPTDTPTLTLVTCYPFTFVGRAPQRFIEQATREDDLRPPDRSE